MTSQTLINSPIHASDANGQHRSRLIEAMKSQYQLDQQVEFLYLQAETDLLLQQLQALKQQRQVLAGRLTAQ